MTMSKRFRRQLFAFSALAATACAAPAAEPRAAGPALWAVADEDTTIYLFGTIHMLPKEVKWRSPAFDKAASNANTLVVETIIDETNPAATIGELFKLAVSDGLPPLASRVPVAKKEALTKAIAESGLPAPMFDKLETWAAAFLLLGAQFKELGLDPNSGVEMVLKKQFKDGGKAIDQLETNSEQLGFFDKLSEDAQRRFLEGVLDDPAAMKGQFAAMLDAWTRGDVKAIGDSFNDELDEEPELEQALLFNRNVNWVKWVKGRLDKPGTVLVAVGAGHLAGDQSVVSLLEKDGVKVKRVQ